MTARSISLEYANGLMFEMQKAFWDERGKGARFRMTTIGREFYTCEIQPLLSQAEIPDILKVVEGVLTAKGIVGQVIYSQDERLLKVSVTGCIHRSIEEQFVLRGVEPFTCIPANMIVLAIEEKLDRPVELAEIKLVEGACELLLVVFDERPTLS